MTTPIDLTRLSYDELVDLNAQIIERLKVLDAAEDVQSMMRFNLGNRVSFDAGRHGMKVGTIIKFNQKTVVVLTEDANKTVRWKVPPHLLSPVIDSTSTTTNTNNVIGIHPKK